MATQPFPRNPKRGSAFRRDRHLFPYYAGYNPDFVSDVLDQLGITNGTTILDPWNGAGTTTTTALQRGINVLGYDINPVMVVVAKSALLDPGVLPSISPLADELNAMRPVAKPVGPNDPLTTWFTPASAGEIRGLMSAIWSLFISTKQLPSMDSKEISELSTLASFFLVALFRTTRKFLTRFIGSNPTWVRDPRHPSRRVRPDSEAIYTEFRRQLSAMERILAEGTPASVVSAGKTPRHGIAVASSTDLPVPPNSIDAVITSPPYLTRIDYAVATKPELAVLGLPFDERLAELRRSMIGTPTICRASTMPSPHWGTACLSFIESIQTHPTKASSSYYAKQALQYFEAMDASLRSISRSLRKGAFCVLVVQDSFYKNIHADLAMFVSEMASIHSLSFFDRHDFVWKRNMVRVNSRSRSYREATNAVESVLWFKKSA